MKGHIEKRENGNFRAKVYVSSTGKYISKTFKTKREAQAWCNETLTDMQKGRFAATTSLSLSAWAKEWLDYHVALRVRPRTLEQYSQAVNDFTEFVGPNSLLRDVTSRHVVAWINYLSSKMKGKTVNLRATIIGSMFNDADSMELINRNPFKGVRKPSPKSDVGTYWSLEELQEFLRAAETHRMYPLFATALYTGMRWGELAGLMWEDVDLKKATITVRRTWARGVYGPTKTDSSVRVISLPSALCQILQQHRRNQIAFIASSVVFAGHSGKPWPQGTVRIAMDQITQAAGVRRIRFHDLRHTHASLLFEQDVPAKVIQERLGHASLGTTMDTYTHITRNKHDSVALKLDALMAHSQDIPKEQKGDA